MKEKPDSAEIDKILTHSGDFPNQLQVQQTFITIQSSNQVYAIYLTPNKAFSSSENYRSFSYLTTKTYIVALLMSTHNIIFWWRNKKYPLLSGPI